ncbi:hypothetical protein [Neobacillus jeddahensis]|uniref:hypothetical protein n=1 Tax=Neobacillus jeddahensis TaxID=1461580 RepID=UPI00058C45CF|nr:hypothetical protein [Neobacillus jeddahensis]
MKGSHIMIVLVIVAWPFYYLYQRQLGAISFLLLAIFFLIISIKEIKKLKEQKKQTSELSSKEKIE